MPSGFKHRRISRRAFSSEGHYRASSTDAAAMLRYVVRTKDGQETLTPAEMEKRYGWKNDPAKMRLTP